MARVSLRDPLALKALVQDEHGCVLRRQRPLARMSDKGRVARNGHELGDTFRTREAFDAVPSDGAQQPVHPGEGSELIDEGVEVSLAAAML